MTDTQSVTRPAPTKSKQPSPAPKGARALRQLAKQAAAPLIGHNGGPALTPRPPPAKHAYTLQELRDLGYGSAPFLYEEMADERLIGTKLGRRTVVLAEHLDAWLVSRPRAISRYRAGRRKSARPPRSPRSTTKPAAP